MVKGSPSGGGSGTRIVVGGYSPAVTSIVTLDPAPEPTFKEKRPSLSVVVSTAPTGQRLLSVAPGIGL